MASSTEYPVNLHDGDDANGIASILATLLDQNFQNYPNRVKTARKISRPVAVYSPDTDSAATIVFGTREAVVRNDIVDRPAVTVKATVNQILNVSQLPMKAGGLMPVGFFTKRGMSVLGNILKHSLVVKGLLIHTITALRLIALLSVAK
ncbi:MAG: hypothetical protein ACRDTK_00205 [Mycobacterium sp.]